MLGTLLVRPREDHYEVVDGEHRLAIARELKLAEVPCAVIELSDFEAKIKTLQLNGFRGENDPELLARLLLDLSLEKDILALTEELPLDRFDIEASLELLSLKDQSREDESLDRRMEEEAKREIFAAVVTPEERVVIEQALAEAQARLGLSAPGEALVAVCREFLKEAAK